MCSQINDVINVVKAVDSESKKLWLDRKPSRKEVCKA